MGKKIGYLLYLEDNKLYAFEKVSLTYNGSNLSNKYNLTTLEQYRDFGGFLITPDMGPVKMDDLGDYHLSRLYSDRYILDDHCALVFVEEDKLDSLFSQNYSQEEKIKLLTKIHVYHINISMKALCMSAKVNVFLGIWATVRNKDSKPMSESEFNDYIAKKDKQYNDAFGKLNQALLETNLAIAFENDLNKKVNKSQNNYSQPSQISEKTRKVSDFNVPPISKTISNITENVIAQDEAVKKSVLAVYSNLDLITQNLSMSELATLKNNILISGKSGCGKTEIARQLSAHLSLPVCIEDITQYTGSGWAGCDLNELLKKLYLVSGKNLEVAQRGILVLDEIDKIAVDKANNRRSHNTLEVQQGILKIIEGGIFEIELDQSKKVPFDTRYLTVIGTGAFNGYNREDDLSSENKVFFKQDYINYGLMPELVGRIKTFITLNNLSFEDKKRILLESKLSVLNLKLEDLKSLGINVNMQCSIDELCDAIIKRSEKLSNGDCGVRDFNEIAYNMFTEIYYRLYDGEKINEVTFDETIVENPKQIILK